jgi:hypothetical protein
MEKFSFVYGNMKITIEPVDQFEKKWEEHQIKKSPTPIGGQPAPAPTWYPNMGAAASVAGDAGLGWAKTQGWQAVDKNENNF